MKSAHIVTVGQLGESIAQRLSDLIDIVTTKAKTKDGISLDKWPEAKIHILAAWRSVPSIADAMENAAFALQVPWLPIVCEHPNLYIGPTVVPNAGPCYACFRKRLLQHSSWPHLIKRLNDYYDLYPDVGPQGFLPPIASLAAATAFDIIKRINLEPLAEAGKIRRINVISMRLLQGRITGIHLCHRCGSGRLAKSLSVLELKRDLDGMGLNYCESL